MLRWGWLNRLLGNRGERIAARYLSRQGYRILARQARNKVGEIDLIAQAIDKALTEVEEKLLTPVL